MSEPSSYNTFESEEESSGWLMSSESAIDEDEDDLSDELTLLNGDENSDDDSLLDDELSQRLKEKYKLQEATVGLERCDKIWDTMQLLKKIQGDYDSENALSDDEEAAFHGSRSASRLPEQSSSSVPYIKYQPVQGNGNNALPNFYLAVKSQRKVYHCVTCGRQYSERRSLRLHSQKEHGIVLPPERHKNRSTGEARTLRPRTPSDQCARGVRDSIGEEKVAQSSKLRRRAEDPAKDLPVVAKRPDSTELNQLLGIALECPLCPATFTNIKRLQRHSIDFHAMSVKEARKKRRLQNRKASKIGRKAASSSESLSETSKSSDSKTELREKLEKSAPGQKFRNSQIRTIDGVKYRYLYTCKNCDKKFVLRKSLRVHTARHHGLHLPSYKRGGFLAALNNNEIFKAELIKVEDEAITTRSGKSYSGGRSKSGKRKGIERPKRACALRTSYTECTKREEEVLQKTLAGVPASPPKTPPKTPPATTDCFLCKRPFVDMRKHLVDYHRINSPESVLPLAKTEPEEAPVRADAGPEQVAKPKERRSREATAVAIEAGEDPRVAVVRGSNGRKTYQCALCRYKYKNLSTIVNHLKVNTVNGVLQEHEIYVRYRHKGSTEKEYISDPVADPLALTDFSEGSKSNSNGNATSDDDSSISRKRTTSSSDERLTPSPEPGAKRRKIEDEIAAIERAEEESVIALSESDCRSVEEVKSSHRDTRDSSDRDSGIGISITIKKRNDSYEVVERDEARTRETPSTKDECVAFSCDSSTDLANGDFYRENDRGCEIVDSIDCSKDEGVPEAMRTEDGDDVENESETAKSSEADFGFRGTETGDDEARDKRGGNVPSLIVLSRTALNRDKSSITITMNDEFTIPHKCPLCCRSYATERDVTIHMLEHKVN